MPSLVKSLPLCWKNLKIFLQRADEFHEKDPVVAYFLRTHVLHLAIQQRNKSKDESEEKEKKEEDAFLKLLLAFIDGEKTRLGKQLDGVDGRTVLTKVALELFNRAEGKQQAGQCDISLVRLFFTSALLFEATSQFTKDHLMDAVASERCRYAKYMGSSLKKKLDQTGTSLSILNDVSSKGMTYSGLPLSSSSPTTPGVFSNEINGSEITTPACQHQQLRPRRSPATTPTTAAGGGSFDGSPGISCPRLSDDNSSKGRKEEKENKTSIDSIAVITDPESPIPGGNGRVTLNDLLKAQQHAKKSVSALQFLDYTEAVRELRRALQMLEQ